MGLEEEVNQEQNQIEKGEESLEKNYQISNIPPAESIQWSNVTIRKKSKKKSYKFWQTSKNGKDMFDLDKEEISRIEDKGEIDLLIPIEIEK